MKPVNTVVAYPNDSLRNEIELTNRALDDGRFAMPDIIFNDYLERRNEPQRQLQEREART